VALVLSAFLVVNTVSALLTQQRRQIGVMKAVGARAGQITSMYLVTVLAFAALALGVGVPLGTLGAYWMGGFMASMVNFNMTNFAPTPHVLALQAAVGLGVPLLAALWPILSGVRITAREAMSAHGTGKAVFGKGMVDRVLEQVRGLSRPTLLSLRNTFRRKGRLILTLSTLVLGGATFIAVFCVRDSTVVTLDTALNYFKYDLAVGFRKAYRTDYIESVALRVPGVVKAESPNGASVRPLRGDGSEGDTVSMLALKADTEMIEPILLEGRWLLPGDDNAVVLNSIVTQREPSLKVGSEVVFTGDGRETKWTVVGIVRGVMTGPIVYANKPYFDRIMRSVGHTGELWLSTDRHDAASRSRITRELNEVFKAEGIRVGTISAMADERVRIQSQFDLLVVFLLLMAGLMAVVGGLGLMGTMSLNVLERTREIGVMRAVGASDGAVRRVFLVEGILIGVLSWAVGAVFALPISQVLSHTVGISLLNAALTYAYSGVGTLIWLVVVIVLSVLASLLPARSASRLSVREVLAYE
jgi:putative ABC transport system permease protein